MELFLFKLRNAYDDGNPICLFSNFVYYSTGILISTNNEIKSSLKLFRYLDMLFSSIFKLEKSLNKSGYELHKLPIVIFSFWNCLNSF